MVSSKHRTMSILNLNCFVNVSSQVNSIKTLLNVFTLKRGTEEILADVCKSREKEREKIILNE